MILIKSMVFYVFTRGGFGNVLFNYIFGYALGKKYGVQVQYINNHDKRRPMMSTYSIFRDEVYTSRTVKNANVISEEGFTYSDRYMNITNLEADYLVDGYFQSYKYSTDVIDEIRVNLFGGLSKYVHPQQTIMLHVRRGDYTQLQDYHPLQSDAYYSEALKWITSKVPGCTIKVFSDDINFIRRWPLLKEYPHEIMTITGEVECVNYMRQCNHFVISNSTFSLMSYYLREDKHALLCIPSKWFGSKGPVFKIDDLVQVTENVRVI